MTRQQLIAYIIGSLTLVGSLVGITLYNGGTDPITGVPNPITVDGQTITFDWTDDNTGEGIHLYTDKQTYTEGISHAEVYVAVVNNSGSSQNVTFNGLFNSQTDYIDKAYVLTQVTEDIPVYGEVCRDEMVTNATTSKKEKVNVCTTEQTSTDRVTKPQWGELPLDTYDSVAETTKLNGRSKKNSDGYTPSKSLNYTMDVGEVVYLKLLLNFELNKSGNFFLEAIGDTAIGHLDPWFNASWDYRVAITVDDAKVPSTQTSFPVYVDLADMPSNFHTNVKEDGCDIRVVESDETTETAFELVSYASSTDTGELHFMADSLTGSGGGDTTFYIYYGNSGASCYATTDTYGAEAVWSAYQGLWHMEGSVADSTATGNDGTDTNVTYSATSPTIGQHFGVSGTGYSSLTDSTATKYTGSYTISWWVKTTATDFGAMYSQMSLASNFKGISMRMNNTSPNKLNWNHMHSTGDSGDMVSSGQINTGNWILIHCVYDTSANTRTIYFNGSSDSSTGETNDATWLSAGSDYFRIGARKFGAGAEDIKFNGNLDEMRARGTALSANWITTEYNNQSDTSTFYTVGSEETNGGGGTNNPQSIFWWF